MMLQVRMETNEMLVKIANDFHKRTLGIAPCDYGGSTADMVEDELVAILNEHAVGGRIRWRGLGKGYGFEEEE